MIQRIATHRTLLALLVLPLAACQAYSDMRTSVANGFRTIRFEVAPEVAKVATVGNLSVSEKVPGMAAGFNVAGEVSHGSACPSALTLDVSFVGVGGVILTNTSALVPAYPANAKARFTTGTYAGAKVGSRDEVIDKVVITGLRCA